MKKINTCKKCEGKGQYMYDENHVKPCEVCCMHPNGWWKMEQHYGEDNGKYACKRGCGTIVDQVSDGEETLMQLTKDALADVLGREPTQQEILRAHADFKRMAFIMHEHLRQEEKKKTAPDAGSEPKPKESS